MSHGGRRYEVETKNDQPKGDLFEAVKDALTEQLERDSLMLAKRLRSQTKLLREHQAYGEGFKKRLARTWRNALTLYEVLLLSAVDAGSDFYTDHSEDAAQDNDFAFEALTSLHARACLVAGEVLELLRGGWPHGAHARCRTLHEFAVFSVVIGEHRELGERFLVHDVVEDARSMDTYQAKLAGRSGHKTFSQEEVDNNHARRDEAIQRFGTSFGRRCGWAAPLFPKDGPTFGQLEEVARLDHLRPFYDWATHLGVHASSRGARLNVLRRGDDTMRLVGPTNAGLADPGHSALISLVQVTTNLLLHGRPLGVDTMPLVIAKALVKLCDEAGDAFLDDERRLAAKEARFQEAEAERATKSAKAKPTGNSCAE
jgi:hypothetical protein